MAKPKREILTGIEVGTGTIKVVMGESLPDDVIAIVGVGEADSLKVLKGEVVDATVVQEQLERALAAAEHTSGLEIGPVFLAVSGGHIRTVNGIGSTLVSSPDRKISEEDVLTAAQNAHAYNLPPDRMVLHYFDRCYRIDGNREVANPLGLVGSRVEADIHIIYGQRSRIETSCSMIAEVMGYPVADVAFSAVAAGLATFDAEDMEKGGLLIDIGAGVTDYIVFHGPACSLAFRGPTCFHSGQVTIGCDHIANDLSLGLRLPVPKCRKLLHDLAEFGSAVMTPDGRSRIMAFESLGQPVRNIPISSVEQVVDLRLRELFEVILADLRAHGVLERVSNGIRLCGGGAQIPGVVRLAQQVFQMPVSLAKPRLLSGKQEVVNSARYLTPVGAIRWGQHVLATTPDADETFWRQIPAEGRRLLGVLRGAFRW